jgi:prepilin-type N-terminal cleavage/methylation domain-containing protein
MNKRAKQKGFTIIEVVLVLAIAGLIFLMVFIALPALQRTQRDTQRKADMGRVETSLSSYQANNKNALPPATDTGWATFMTNYLLVGTDSFQDPSFGSYVFKYKGTTYTTPTDPVSNSGEIWVFGSATCNGEVVQAGSSRQVALAIKLEGGGVYCVNN